MFGLFSKKDKYHDIPRVAFDSTVQSVVVKKSICNGERVVGFKHNTSKEFVEIMAIKSDEDLNRFLKAYGVSEYKQEY